jgi:putative SOS response-associated peptidase YedK
MCGRFVATTAPQQLAMLFDAALGDELDAAQGDERGPPDAARERQFSPNYNVAPTTQVTTLVTESRPLMETRRTLRRAHWGLLPSWSKDRSRASSMINARRETLAEKPSFRPLLAAHRCALPVDGYYEWRTNGVDPKAKYPKQPYFIRSPDAAPFALAALWTLWRDPERDGAAVRSCAIITTSPNETLAAIHDRMPCVLDGADLDEWLSEGEAPLDLLRAAPEERLVAHTVSTDVNSVRNKGAQLIEPVRTTLF